MTTFPFWASLDGMPRMRTQIATLLYRPFSFLKGKMKFSQRFLSGRLEKNRLQLYSDRIHPIHIYLKVSFRLWNFFNGGLRLVM